MGFKNYYKETFYGQDAKGSRYETIFPFFGFHYESVDTSYDSLEKNHDTATISGNTITFRSGGSSFVKNYRYDRIYERTVEPTGREKELEDKFYEIQKKKAFGKEGFEWKLSHIYTSLSDYIAFERTGGKSAVNSVSGILGGAVVVGWILAIVVAIIGGLLYLLNVNIDFEEIGSFLDGISMESIQPFLPFAGLAVFAIFVWIGVSAYRKAKRVQETQVRDLSPKEYKSLRKQYLNSMTAAYGREAGKILQEYAILKGYDRF